ncbi:hypothetical protein [Enterococcus sp. AZ072]|uniref:hypothetical protein n=1 Tax=unclassified Enterococcus TaxID=2608891 RepID=UPI003D270985
MFLVEKMKCVLENAELGMYYGHFVDFNCGLQNDYVDCHCFNNQASKKKIKLEEVFFDLFIKGGFDAHNQTCYEAAARLLTNCRNL